MKARRRAAPDRTLLGERLSALAAEWEGRRLDSDPLLFPHRYAADADREVVAFVAASLAFGRVASILASVERVLASLGPSPSAFLRAWDGSPVPGLLGFRHRWVGPEDLHAFLRAVAAALTTDGSLRERFARLDPGGEDAVEALDAFYASLRRDALPWASGRPSRGLRFLLPAPAEGGACKRAHLFLRWMVRDGGFDLGIWRSEAFPPSRLLLPLDTHVHRICRYLGLTARPTADLKAAREATAVLRQVFPDDPAGADWALSRLGILAECVTDPLRCNCEPCPVRPVCRRGRRRGGPRPAPNRVTSAP